MAYAKAAIEALATPVPGENGERDERRAPVRRADAMADLIRRALNGGEAFGRFHHVRPHLTVTFGEDALRGEPGAFGQTATGERLAANVLRRLLCDCDLTWVQVDEHGVPLFMGRRVRTATPGQWIALTVRDGGCCFPGCTRPPMYCEAHHFPEWSNGGHTDLDTMGLFCSAHHHFLHDKGWTARLGPDGHVELIPPPWHDPLQQPRRNWHWHNLRDLTTPEHERGP